MSEKLQQLIHELIEYDPAAEKWLKLNYPLADKSKAGALWTDCYTCKGRGLVEISIQAHNNQKEWLAGARQLFVCPACSGLGMNPESYTFAIKEYMQ